jgi:hypothetical protein
MMSFQMPLSPTELNGSPMAMPGMISIAFSSGASATFFSTAAIRSSESAMIFSALSETPKILPRSRSIA